MAQDDIEVKVDDIQRLSDAEQISNLIEENLGHLKIMKWADQRLERKARQGKW